MRRRCSRRQAVSRPCGPPRALSQAPCGTSCTPPPCPCGLGASDPGDAGALPPTSRRTSSRRRRPWEARRRETRRGGRASHLEDVDLGVHLLARVVGLRVAGRAAIRERADARGELRVVLGRRLVARVTGELLHGRVPPRALVTVAVGGRAPLFVGAPRGGESAVRREPGEDDLHLAVRGCSTSQALWGRGGKSRRRSGDVTTVGAGGGLGRRVAAVAGAAPLDPVRSMAVGRVARGTRVPTSVVVAVAFAARGEWGNAFCFCTAPLDRSRGSRAPWGCPDPRSPAGGSALALDRARFLASARESRDEREREGGEEEPLAEHESPFRGA